MTAPPATLGIGTAGFLLHYGLSPAEMPPDDGVLRAAIDAGVPYVDTAADYGDSEEAVGRVRQSGLRICTKIGSGGSLDAIRASVARLRGTPDSILLHSAGREQIVSAPAVGALERARTDGLTRRIGASTYGCDDAAFALSRDWVDVVQVEYSILNQSVVRALARSRPDQEVVVRSVLCKGLLTNRRSAAPMLAAQVADALDGIEGCARAWGFTVEGLAIRFALDTPGIDVVLVGVSSRAELDAALSAAEAPALNPDQWSALAAFDRSGLDAAHPERWPQTA